MGSQRTGLTNYLDDYLFIAIAQAICNAMVDKFIAICKEIGLPISAEKTAWADPFIIFLGILMDGYRKLLVIPEEKRCKAIYTIKTILAHKKVTVKQLQCLMGLLNFLGCAVVPGRALTRWMYTKIPQVQKKDGKVSKLKSHHHINLDQEFRNDCQV